jgi:hypothetical protein
VAKTSASSHRLGLIMHKWPGAGGIASAALAAKFGRLALLRL